MSEINNYPIDFVQRTKEILETSYNRFELIDREVTFLLNCLLGLIVSVDESENRNKNSLIGNIDDDFLGYIPNKIGFLDIPSNLDSTNETETELIIPIKHRNNLRGFSKKWFVQNLRNAIAHQNIEGVNEEGQWIGVRMFNKNNSGIKDFEVIFTKEELKSFADYIAQNYLNQTNNNGNSN